MTTSKSNPLADGWPDPSRYRRSIRVEFSLYMSGIILLMMLVTGIVITDRYVDTVSENVVETLLVQARSYSGPAGKHIISSDVPDALLLNNACKRLLADNPDIYWAGIADNQGRFIGHTDITQVIGEVAMTEITTVEPNVLLRENEQIDLRGDTIFTSVPIVEDGLEIGRLGLASSSAQIKQARLASIIAVASITIVMLLLGLPGTMFILHRKLRPVSVITNTLIETDLDNLLISIPVKTRNELGYLAETIEVMGAKLGDAQRHLLEKDRIARELEIAHEIQTNILPRSYPKTEVYEFAGIYQSAKEIGGDYFDFVNVDANHVAVLVADVSGKSLPGMLVMLLTRDIVRQHVDLMKNPAELLCRVNQELGTNIKKGMFVTMFFGILDTITGIMEFASAGHNPLVHMDEAGQQVELIKTKGYPLGMMPAAPFEKRIEAGRVNLRNGDWLIQYTDGINEALSTSGEEYGMERFVDQLRSSSSCVPEVLIQSTMKQHQGFVGDAEQYDDITLLAMKWHGTGVRKPSRDVPQARPEDRVVS